MPAPANDNFASREAITGGSGTTGPRTIDLATTEASEPFGPDVKQTIWFSWTAPSTGVFRFLTDPEIGAGRVASAAAFTGTVLASLVNVNTDSPPSGAERTAFAIHATSGAIYAIQLGVYFTPTATGTITLRWETVSPPANDNFAAALHLATGVSTGAIDAAAATVQGSEPSPSVLFGGPFQTTWYRWTAPSSAAITVDLTGTVGSNTGIFDEWVLAVWTGSTLAALVEVTSADLSGSERTVTFDAVEGTTYRVQVSTLGGNSVAQPIVRLYVTQAPIWIVEHYEHEFTAVTVGDPEIEANGVLLNTVRPENLHFLWQLAELGPSEIDYEISLTAMDEIMDLPVVGLDFVRPYFQDWSLYRGDQLLLAGMITSLSIQAGSECVKLGGKDWLHYLERRMWPYDADLSYINWPDGFRFKVKAAEVGQIVQDMLETVRDVSGNYPGPPDDVTFPSYSLKFLVDCNSTGTNRNYEIGAFETSSVYDLIRSLSQMDKSDGGFDFYMTPDRPPSTTFKLVYPEIGDPDTPIFTLQIDEATALANMLEVGYTDSGPEASHVLGVGAGTATRSGGVNKHLRIVSARTRRLDKVGDYGDVKNLPTLESKSLADLNRAWRSIHEIPILVDPADIPGFWEVAQPGAYIMVDYDLFGHRIDSVQKIVSMDVNVDTEGNERVQLGLNQQVDGGSTDVASDP